MDLLARLLTGVYDPVYPSLVTVFAGVEIDLQFRKFCAMVSKLLLMASVGSSFSQPGMGELNEYLKQASTDVLRMLDHLAVRPCHGCVVGRMRVRGCVASAVSET